MNWTNVMFDITWGIAFGGKSCKIPGFHRQKELERQLTWVLLEEKGFTGF